MIKSGIILTLENGMLLRRSCVFQSVIIWVRNSWLNGPVYDRKPVASKTSPTSLPVSASKPLLASVQRMRSPDKPSIRAVALSILRRQAFASSTSACNDSLKLLETNESFNFTIVYKEKHKRTAL